MELKKTLPFSVKNSTWQERTAYLAGSLGLTLSELNSYLGCPDPEVLDAMVESAVGCFSQPLGLLWDLPVNGKFYKVPMATEEPSVLAAANYMAKILKEVGIQTEVVPAELSGQIYLKASLEEFTVFWESSRSHWEQKIENCLSSMKKRGGGYISSSVRFLEELGIVVWDIFINPCDAQGANTINGLLELLSTWLDDQGFEVSLKILSNNLNHNPSRASFSLPLSHLAHFGYSTEVVEKLVLNSHIGQVDPMRAVTHNKGIMNGITALALATGNDTRALEVGVHTYSSRSGQVRALSRYCVQGKSLVGEIELPLALATVGGATKVHPTASLVLKILGITHSRELKEVAIALGLAQNLGAMLVLSSYGIQKGHMSLHRRRNQILGEENG